LATRRHKTGSTRKVRVQMKQNRQTRVRQKDWMDHADPAPLDEDSPRPSERIATKGDLSRRRTVVEGDHPEAVSEDGTHESRHGLVLYVHGTSCEVVDQGRTWTCYVRQVLRSLLIEERQPVAPGDRVQFRCTGPNEGLVLHVDPRRSKLMRHYRQRGHTVVANMDQIVIVTSLRQPPLKMPLIDRYLVAAGVGDVAAIVCLNKVDLDRDGRADEAADMYRHIGYPVVLASAVTGQGVDELTYLLKDRTSVLAGHSGVGKSSLLNCVQPGLNLREGPVSQATLKGKHTTALTRLIPLEVGGYVADTPGIRQFALWKVEKREIANYFVEFASVAGRCPFPNCQHLDELDCAVKRAVQEQRIHPDRYASYVRIATS